MGQHAIASLLGALMHSCVCCAHLDCHPLSGKTFKVPDHTASGCSRRHLTAQPCVRLCQPRLASAAFACGHLLYWSVL
jgi:hypothetical protein